jgi:hypothetical protein
VCVCDSWYVLYDLVDCRWAWMEFYLRHMCIVARHVPVFRFTILSESLDIQERHVHECMKRDALFRGRAKFHCWVLHGCIY